VGIEVVLAVPAGRLGNRRVDREAGRHDLLDGATVDDRQRPRQAEADGTGQAVGRSAVGLRRAGAEHLARSPELAVDLDADDRLVSIQGPAGRGRAPASDGRHPGGSSEARTMRNIPYIAM